MSESRIRQALNQVRNVLTRSAPELSQARPDTSAVDATIRFMERPIRPVFPLNRERMNAVRTPIEIINREFQIPPQNRRDSGVAVEEEQPINPFVIIRDN